MSPRTAAEAARYEALALVEATDPVTCPWCGSPPGEPCRNRVSLEQREAHGIGICASCYSRMRRRLDPGPLDAD